MRTTQLLRPLAVTAVLSLLLCLTQPALTADPGPAQRTLTVLCGDGGTVSTEVISGSSSSTLTGPGVFVLDDGVEVTVTALVKAGWRFMSWTGTMASGERDFTFTLTCDQKIEAHFAQNPRTLVVTCGEGGAVTEPGVGSFVYQPGATIPVEATVKLGYRFAGWTGTIVDRSDVANPNLIKTNAIVNESGTLVATFAAIRDFHESWESAIGGIYTPAKTTFIHADEGAWSLDDAVSESGSCGSTPQRAEIVKLDSGQALLLTSADSRSRCSDIVSVSLTEAGLVNPGFALTIDANMVLSFHEVGLLDRPGLHDPAKDCQVPPCFDNVSLLLGDNRGNVLAYVLQRRPDATANIPNANFDGTYREIFLDPSGVQYRRHLLDDLLAIPAFEAKGAQVRSVEFRVDAHGSAIIDNLTIGSAAVDENVPVYRFWSPSLESHFFTADANEKQSLIDLHSSTWTFEGIAYFVPADDRSPGAAPVYRFFSPALSSYFYTISESERDMLLRYFPDVWTLEGVFFYVYPEGRQPADARPVYRFWSGVLSRHFYTISEKERDNLVANFPDVWTLEGVAWYAYPPQWESGQALNLVRGNQTPVQPRVPVEVTIDNADPGASSLGTWYVSSRLGCWGTDSMTTTGAGSTFTWTATLAPGATYAVYAWWTEGPLRYTTVPYEIRDGGTVLGTTVVNQAANGGKWNLLGVYSFTEPANVTVSADPASVASVNADAVRFTPMTR
jgi:hypothetical protein